MLYTFGQAKKKLMSSTHAYVVGAHRGNEVADLADAINDAIQALAGMSGWDCLRKVVRIATASPVFALPQGCAGLVRACVAGRPVTVRGQDFEFLHSGPGDLRSPPHGYQTIPGHMILDRGTRPIEVVPPPCSSLVAYSAEEGQPDLVVKYVDPSGDVRTSSLPVTAGGIEDAVLCAQNAQTQGAPDIVVGAILSVNVSDSASARPSLAAVYPDGTPVRLATYAPQVSVPSFHIYEVHGSYCGCPCGGSYDILAEVRLEPLPLVEDTDVVPFDSLEPIEWMIHARWLTKAGEIDSAQKYQALAANWLKAREATDRSVQTSVVFNNLFSMSLGEPSMDAINI